MFNIKVITKNPKNNYWWFDEAESFTSNEDTFTVKWWSVGSQEYIYSTFNKSEIKKIKIKSA